MRKHDAARAAREDFMKEGPYTLRSDIAKRRAAMIGMAIVREIAYQTTWDGMAECAAALTMFRSFANDIITQEEYNESCIGVREVSDTKEGEQQENE